MNTTMNNMPVAVYSNPVTAKMIAEKLGMNVFTVKACLCKNARKMSKEKVNLVRKTAEEMGYDPKTARALSPRNYWAKTAEERKAKKKAKKDYYPNYSVDYLEMTECFLVFLDYLVARKDLVRSYYQVLQAKECYKV